MSRAYREGAAKALKLAEAASKELKHYYIGTEHILIGLMREEGGVASNILKNQGIEVGQLIDLVKELITPAQDALIPDKKEYSPSAKALLEAAENEAAKYKDDEIGTEHILLAIVRDSQCSASRILNTLNVNVLNIFVEIMSTKGIDKSIWKDDIPGANKNKQNQSILDQFSRDLTSLALLGKLDPVIGRKEEISRAIQILSRRGKNNPCLIGEPGVGKTAIVEGLATMIVNGKVPDTVKDKRLLNLDLSSVVAGTKYRGEFEERIKKIIAEVIEAGNIILFIDELHTIIGAGGAEGALDASNILKPALARGEIQLIGATTLSEYRKYVEKDAALERRFQPITVSEPTEAEAISILKGIRHKYEEHHNVEISDEAIEASVKLSARYINDRNLPDKAIDIIDEASAKARLSDLRGEDRIKESIEELESLNNTFEDALSHGDMETAAEMKAKLSKQQESLDRLLARAEKRPKGKKISLKEEDITAMVAEWTKIPLKRLEEKESARLEKMDKVLHQRVIGQEEAVQAVVRAVKRGRVGLKDPKRPIGSFLFLGPTGVGKTELSKALAEALFGDENSIIRVDMSEYMEKHSVSKMIGSPPGYVGFEEGGQLSEKVRRNPYAVILFDEIEKAHPDVFNILLQVLDDGHITDAQGRKVDFKNTIIIMTSNAGASAIIEPKLLGFASKEDKKRDYEVMKNGVMEEVKRIFKPEFLNRIDEIIVFHALTETELESIVSLQCKILASQCLESMGLKVTVSPAVKKDIVKKAYDQKYGARPLKRMIQNRLEDGLCEELLSGRIHAGDSVQIGLKKGKIVFTAKN